MRWRALFPIAIACLSGCKSSTTSGLERKETDVDSLHGVWVADAYERDGKPVGNGLLEGTRIVVKGGKFELRENSEFGEKVEFELDEDANPKQIDLHMTKGRVAGQIAEGIYRLDGDSLRICWAAPGQPRPTEFTTRDGMGFACLTLHRHRESD